MSEFRAQRLDSFSLPRQIDRLGTLAYNLWWTWTPEAMRLYKEIDQDLWEETYHNPIKFLREVSRARLNAVIHNRYYMLNYESVMEEFDKYVAAEKTWFAETYPDFGNCPIAYFSSEFGLHEMLPIYAGGLGVLSGDHIKEASDLGLPMIAVGFLYTHGYFSQKITEDGWQEKHEMRLDFDNLPVLPVMDANNEVMKITVQLLGHEVHARIWEVRVGRVPLYLWIPMLKKIRNMIVP